MLVSIIVPVYNVSQYLKACLDSIINQTYNEIEIILIDDGSTDDSGNLCDNYRERDERIQVIHQKNAGLSAARNAGIKAANGEYITFIDSDDYIAPDYIEKLLYAIVQNSADISICDLKKVPEQMELNNLDYASNESIKPIKLTNCQAITEVYHPLYHGVDFVSVAKLYNRSLFISNRIDFPVGRIHEDAFTTYKLLYAARNIIYIDIPMYFYRIRGGSITTSKFSLKKLDKIVATKEECDFFLKEKKYDLLQLALFDHLHETKIIISNLCKSGNEYADEKKIVAKNLRSDLAYYGSYVDIPLKKKIYYSMLAFFPWSILADI